MVNKQELTSLFKQPFTLLDDYQSRWFLVAFSGLFATFFVYFFNPFDILNITYQSAAGNFLSILTVGLWGSLSLIITQFGLRMIIGLRTFRLDQFLLWVHFELTFLGLISFFIFGELDKPWIKEFGVVLRYTLSLAILPYFLACLIIAVFKLSIRSKKQEAALEQSEQPLILKEQNEKVALTLNPVDLLYLKSESNYTQVVYLDHGVEAKKLLRNNLKTLATELNLPGLLRIHRSYMIYQPSINKVERHKGTYRVQLAGIPELWLKVTESYKSEFEKSVKL